MLAQQSSLPPHSRAIKNLGLAGGEQKGRFNSALLNC